MPWTTESSPHSPKELLSPKDGEDEQQGDTEDDSHQVGKDPEVRVADTLSERVVARDGDGHRPGVRGCVLSRARLAPRLEVKIQGIDPRLTQEVATLGLVLETELVTLEDDMVRL